MIYGKAGCRGVNGRAATLCANPPRERRRQEFRVADAKSDLRFRSARHADISLISPSVGKSCHKTYGPLRTRVTGMGAAAR